MKRPLMTLLGSLALGSAYGAEPAALQPGQLVFQRWCAACHAPGLHHPGTLALQHRYQDKLPAALEQRTDLTPALVASFVRNGINYMPPFRKTEISDPELRALADYLAPSATQMKKEQR
ncbi:MAG TPA: c-type cytochrome [Ramlibacter sp.]|nr:c-type cytochrome [Ramlibacter sp.]